MYQCLNTDCNHISPAPKCKTDESQGETFELCPEYFTDDIMVIYTEEVEAEPWA